MSLLSQSCHEAARLISESQDAPLSRGARLGLRLHLALCRQCRRYEQQLRLMRSALHGFPGPAPATGLPDGFREQLVRKLKETA